MKPQKKSKIENEKANDADESSSLPTESQNADTKFVVESGFPRVKKLRTKTCIYPFGSMSIGQSFKVVPNEERKSKSILSAAHAYTKRNKLRMRFGKGQDTTGQWRIYRIKDRKTR